MQWKKIFFALKACRLWMEQPSLSRGMMFTQCAIKLRGTSEHHAIYWTVVLAVHIKEATVPLSVFSFIWFPIAAGWRTREWKIGVDTVTKVRALCTPPAQWTTVILPLEGGRRKSLVIAHIRCYWKMPEMDWRKNCCQSHICWWGLRVHCLW